MKVFSYRKSRPSGRILGRCRGRVPRSGAEDVAIRIRDLQRSLVPDALMSNHQGVGVEEATESESVVRLLLALPFVWECELSEEGFFLFFSDDTVTVSSEYTEGRW